MPTVDKSNIYIENIPDNYHVDPSVWQFSGIPLTNRAGAPPVQWFRENKKIPLVSYRSITGICIDKQNSNLQPAFSYFEYNILQNNFDSPSVKQSNFSLIFQLNAPRQIQSISVDPDIFLNCIVEIHRMDGNAIVDKPSISSLISYGRAQFDGSFIDAHFAISIKMNEKPMELVNQNIFSIMVRSYPTSARISLIPPQETNLETPDYQNAILLWNEAGELCKDVPNYRTPDLRHKLAEALEGNLKRIQNFSESNLAYELIFESDSPCMVDFNNPVIAYGYFKECLPCNKQKHTIKFSADKQESAKITFSIPSGMEFQSAELKISEALDNKSGFYAVKPANTPVLSTSTGLLIRENIAVASKYTGSQNCVCGGIAIAIMSISANSEFTFQICDDFNGKPLGEILFSKKIALSSSVTKQWYFAKFDQPISTDNRILWIKVLVSNGSIVWLADKSSGESVVFDTSTIPPDFKIISIHKDYRPLFQLLLSEYINPTENNTSVLQCTCCDYSLQQEIIDEKNGTFMYSLLTALSNKKTIQTEPLKKNTEFQNTQKEIEFQNVTLTISSCFSGTATVYPLIVKFTPEKNTTTQGV